MNEQLIVVVEDFSHQLIDELLLDLSRHFDTRDIRCLQIGAPYIPA